MPRRPPAATTIYQSKAKDFSSVLLWFRSNIRTSRTPAATTQRENRNDFNTLQKPQERRRPPAAETASTSSTATVSPTPPPTKHGNGARAAARSRQPPPAPTNASPNACRDAIDKVSTGMDQVLEGKLEPAALSAISRAAKVLIELYRLADHEMDLIRSRGNRRRRRPGRRRRWRPPTPRRCRRHHRLARPVPDRAP